MYTVERTPLANRWEDRLPGGYDVVIIGSGYGGAITAARLAGAQWPGAKPSICVLERGREWLPGQFPDNLQDGAGALRSALNPLGLYDFRIGPDIGAWMASGLGGTSLINANVAIEPDAEVFDNPTVAASHPGCKGPGYPEVPIRSCPLHSSCRPPPPRKRPE